MSSRIWESGAFAELLPSSIAEDTTIASAARALDGVLLRTTLAVPNLLLYARLNRSDTTDMLPALARLTAAGGGLKELGLPELEQLAWQFHVDFRDAATTTEQLTTAIRNSIPWHSIKGTPASLHAALRLFGYAAVIEEDGTGDYWATYQLGLPEIADMDDVRRIVTICTEMAPARCRLWRLYTDAYDRRPIVLSEGPALGDGWLSFHSGVPVEGPDGDIVVSFGTKRSFQAEAYLPSLHAASFGTECVSGHTAPYLDRFTVGRSRLSEPLPRNHPFVMGALFSISK